MGVHVNGQGGGGGGVSTSLADTLSKAIFGDPETEMQLALGRQQYESEAWKRRVWDAQIASENAQAANAAAQAADREYQTQSRQDAAGVIANQQAGLLEPPAPVELSPATTRYDLPADAPAIVADDPYSIYAAGQSVAPPLPGGMNLPVVAPPSQLLAGAEPLDSPFGRLQAGETAGLQPPRESFTPPSATDSQLPDIGMPVPVDVPAVTGVRPEDQAAHDRNVAAIKARVTAAMAMGQSAKDIAEGMGVSEGAVRMLSSDPEQQALGTTLYTGSQPAAGSAGGAGFNEAEQKLRKEYFDRKEVQRFDIIGDRYASLVKNASMGGGVGDTGMIYDVIKMLDPGSSVMGGEQVTAANAPGLIASQIAYFNGLLNAKGDKFNDAGRAEFIKMAQGIYETSAASKKRVDDYYTRLATENKLKPENIIMPTGAAPTQPDIVLPAGITESMVDTVIADNPGMNRATAIKLIVHRLTKNP
jgi:hypothetical protein